MPQAPDPRTSPTTYLENAAPLPVATELTLDSLGGALIRGATVSIGRGYTAGEDVLAFTAVAGIHGAFDATTGVLTFTGEASAQAYEDVLRSVTYSNASDNPAGGSRVIQMEVGDTSVKHGVQAEFQARVGLVAVDDLPLLTLGQALAYTQPNHAAPVDPLLTLFEPDNMIRRAEVRFSGDFTAGQDVLDAVATRGIHVRFNKEDGVLTLSGRGTAAQYQEVLRSVTYTHKGDALPDHVPEIEFRLTGSSSRAYVDLGHMAIVTRPAPVVTAPDGSPSYTEGGTAAGLAALVTVTDPDSALLMGATVTITGGHLAQDKLAIAALGPDRVDAYGITAAFDAATGTLTLSGAAPAEHYQRLLREVTFESGSDDPGTARTISWQVNDGQYGSTPVTTTLAVHPVNDAPVTTVPHDPVAGVQSHTPTAIAGISVGDADAGSDAVQTTVSSLHGTVAVTPHGAVVTGNESGSLVVTGTVSQVNAALATLTYQSADGYVGSDTLSVITNDQGATGTGGPLPSGGGVPATVGITVVPQVFVIDNSDTTSDDAPDAGTEANPFNSIASFNQYANDGVGDHIHLKQGTGVYEEAEGFQLLDGQVLTGQGMTLQPTIKVTGEGAHAIELASGNTVTGLNVETTLGNQTGIADGNATVGKLTISNVGISGAGMALDIDQGGTLDVTLAKLGSTQSSQQGLELAGTQATALTGSFTVNNAAISGSAGAGVDLHKVDAAVSFVGLTIETTSGGVGLAGEDIKSLSITGSGNTVASTDAAAIHLKNVGVTSDNLNFQSVSATGGVNGIVLDHTGAKGGLHVTGEGTAQSGGIVSATSGDGIVVNNGAIVLKGMQILDTGGSGIAATNLVGFNQLAESTISGYGTGTAHTSHGFAVSNTDTGSSLVKLEISGTTFSDGGKGDDALHISATGAASMPVEVTGSTFEGVYGDAIDLSTDAKATGTDLLKISGSTFKDEAQAVPHDPYTPGPGAGLLGGGGINLNVQGDVDFAAQVSGNTFDNVTWAYTESPSYGPAGWWYGSDSFDTSLSRYAIDIRSAGKVDADVIVQDNTIGYVGGGIRTAATGGTMDTLIDGNTITHISSPYSTDVRGAVALSAVAVDLHSTVGNLTVSNNAIGDPVDGKLWGYGIWSDWGGYPYSYASAIDLTVGDGSSATAALTGNNVLSKEPATSANIVWGTEVVRAVLADTAAGFDPSKLDLTIAGIVVQRGNNSTGSIGVQNYVAGAIANVSISDCKFDQYATPWLGSMQIAARDSAAVINFAQALEELSSPMVPLNQWIRAPRTSDQIPSIGIINYGQAAPSLPTLPVIPDFAVQLQSHALMPMTGDFGGAPMDAVSLVGVMEPPSLN